MSENPILQTLRLMFGAMHRVDVDEALVYLFGPGSTTPLGIEAASILLRHSLKVEGHGDRASAVDEIVHGKAIKHEGKGLVWCKHVTGIDTKKTGSYALQGDFMSPKKMVAKLAGTGTQFAESDVLVIGERDTGLKHVLAVRLFKPVAMYLVGGMVLDHVEPIIPPTADGDEMIRVVSRALGV